MASTLTGGRMLRTQICLQAHLRSCLACTHSLRRKQGSKQQRRVRNAHLSMTTALGTLQVKATTRSAQPNLSVLYNEGSLCTTRLKNRIERIPYFSQDHKAPAHKLCAMVCEFSMRFAPLRLTLVGCSQELLTSRAAYHHRCGGVGPHGKSTDKP